MNVKAAARGGADSGGGEQSDERGPFSFLFVPKTAVAARHDGSDHQRQAHCGKRQSAENPRGVEHMRNGIICKRTIERLAQNSLLPKDERDGAEGSEKS